MNASQCRFCTEVHPTSKLKDALTVSMGTSCKMATVFILLWELTQHAITTPIDSVTDVSRDTFLESISALQLMISALNLNAKNPSVSSVRIMQDLLGPIAIDRSKYK
jgi:hypothetical protein